jgi:hypothetical protein
MERYRARHSVSGWITKDLFNKMLVWCQGMVMRREIAGSVHWDCGLKTGSDYDFALQLSLQTRLFYVRDIVATRRITQGSVSFAHPESSHLNCDKLRVLERFYRENGCRYFSQREAKRRLSKVCTATAQRHYRMGARKAAIFLFKRALGYDLCNRRAWQDLAMALLSVKASEALPEWEFLPLPERHPFKVNTLQT